jgi:hypothetical protein
MNQVQKLLYKAEYASKVITWAITAIRSALDSFPRYEEPKEQDSKHIGTKSPAQQ